MSHILQSQSRIKGMNAAKTPSMASRASSSSVTVSILSDFFVRLILCGIYKSIESGNTALGWFLERTENRMFCNKHTSACSDRHKQPTLSCEREEENDMSRSGKSPSFLEHCFSCFRLRDGHGLFQEAFGLMLVLRSIHVHAHRPSFCNRPSASIRFHSEPLAAQHGQRCRYGLAVENACRNIRDGVFCARIRQLNIFASERLCHR